MTCTWQRVDEVSCDLDCGWLIATVDPKVIHVVVLVGQYVDLYAVGVRLAGNEDSQLLLPAEPRHDALVDADLV